MRGCLIAMVMATMAASGSALAQAVHAPCRAAADLDGIAAAFRAAGWQDVTEAAALDEAARAFGATVLPLASPPEPLIDAGDATDFVTGAGQWFAREDMLAATPVFLRDGVLAVARLPAHMDGAVLHCHFAATAFPEVEAMLAESGAQPGIGGATFGTGVTFAFEDLDVTQGASVPNSITVMRLEGAPDAIAVLPARYGLILVQFLPQTGG